ncbi:hypothetical protein KFL_000730150 [Klebsormidium nitens]|uniref:Uncharacterized protein n=1 Tax=Klebsormidium nitens TaxID=105231 RepID=A0A1Y1HZ92_KLENI|nr:hypothetical protein KFL_000730150 [Klebsormidium nitens]|eukprot:GAQ81178.1 hypothetical protein KFL_000730150 [Klebsormidium nitens]
MKPGASAKPRMSTLMCCSAAAAVLLLFLVWVSSDQLLHLRNRPLLPRVDCKPEPPVSLNQNQVSLPTHDQDTQTQVNQNRVTENLPAPVADSCPVPCDVLQLANLTTLADVSKVNCNVEYLTPWDVGRFLGARKNQAWLHFTGDSMIRRQWQSIAADLGVEIDTEPLWAVCCKDGKECKTWEYKDINWEAKRVAGLVTGALRDEGFEFCVTYTPVQFISQVVENFDTLFQADMVQPFAVVMNMGLHHIYHGQGQLAYRADLEALTARLRKVREVQRGSDGVTKTMFIYHTLTAYSEELFGFIDPLRRNERTELFVRQQEEHFRATGGSLYRVLDSHRLTKYLDKRHFWHQLTFGDGIHPGLPYYQIASLLDYNFVVKGVISFCTNADDLEYKPLALHANSGRMLDKEAEGDEVENLKAMRRVHGWGSFSPFEHIDRRKSPDFVLLPTGSAVDHAELQTETTPLSCGAKRFGSV